MNKNSIIRNFPIFLLSERTEVLNLILEPIFIKEIHIYAITQAMEITLG